MRREVAISPAVAGQRDPRAVEGDPAELSWLCDGCMQYVPGRVQSGSASSSKSCVDPVRPTSRDSAVGGDPRFGGTYDGASGSSPELASARWSRAKATLGAINSRTCSGTSASARMPRAMAKATGSTGSESV
jgi:hypothetical protein